MATGKRREQILQVRCGYQAAKLLGYLALPPRTHVDEGVLVRFQLKPAEVRGSGVAMPVVRWSSQDPALEHPLSVALPIERFGHEGFWRLALRTDAPITVLRRIDGFIEA